MRLVCTSDTHNRGMMHVNGDILIHAGDLTGRGTEKELIQAAEDIAGYPCRSVVIIPGNHDFLFQEDEVKARKIFEDRIGGHHLKILINQMTEINGVKIYGSPFTPEFGHWAFGYKPEEAKGLWNKIPQGIDVLVTHGPPRFMLDQNPRGEHCGCDVLGHKVIQIQPKYHIFGHIHSAYGFDQQYGVTFLNVSSCSEKYQMLNPPIVVHTGPAGPYERW